MYIEIDNSKYEVVIIKKNNKNTYIRVKDDLKIYVTTNRFVTNRYIENLINENINNIRSMLEKAKNKNEKSKKMLILGKEVNVISFSMQDEPELYNNKFYVKNIDKLDKYIKIYALKIFSERLNIIYNLFEENIPYPKLRIRKMTTRWGVCNKRDRVVTLNLELIRMDFKYIDYVIVHELSHFIHFDHSKEFWNLVSKYCKNYKEIRKEMKE